MYISYTRINAICLSLKKFCRNLTFKYNLCTICSLHCKKTAVASLIIFVGTFDICRILQNFFSNIENRVSDGFTIGCPEEEKEGGPLFNVLKQSDLSL